MPLTKVTKDLVYSFTELVDASDVAFSTRFGNRRVYAYLGPKLKFGEQEIILARYNRDQVYLPEFGMKEDIWFVVGSPRHRGSLKFLIAKLEKRYGISDIQTIANINV